VHVALPDDDRPRALQPLDDRRVTVGDVLGERRIAPRGVQTGDVTASSGVLWARSSSNGRLMARLRSGRLERVVRGPQATAASDFTARIDLDGLAPGRAYEADLWFEDEDGQAGEVQRARFRTAPVHPVATSFVWTGDTAGQGWGINPDLGGMTTYAAMHATDPDFFLHSGDTIYADGPIPESVVEPDGQVWRNLVIPEVTKVAEELSEFRGRHRYNLMDHNVRALYADVPVIAQWDDHETHNNWYPGQILTDTRYTERRVDVLQAGPHRRRRAASFRLLAAPQDVVGVVSWRVDGAPRADDDDPVGTGDGAEDTAEHRLPTDVEEQLVVTAHASRPATGEHDGIPPGGGAVEGHPPIADIGRSGCRNVGSSMPWPAFLPAMLTRIRRPTSSSSAPLRSAARRSDSSRANRQLRICPSAVRRTRSQLPQKGRLTLAMMPTVAGPPST